MGGRTMEQVVPADGSIPLTPAGTVGVFRSLWGAPSETFVRRQAQALTRYRALPIATSTWDDSEALEEGGVVLRDSHPLWFLLHSAWFSSRIPGHRPIHRCPALAPLVGACRRAGVRLLHAHFGPNGLLVLPMVRALRVPLVVTFHGYDVTSFPLSPRYRDDYRRYLFPRAALLIAASGFVRSRLEALGAPQHKLVTHHIGVPLDLYGPPSTCSHREGIRLLSVGRLVECKGHEYLLRAAATLMRAGQRVSLMLVGDGPLRSTLEGLAADLGIESVVQIMGWQTPHSVSELMGDADVFIMPSVTTSDGGAEGMGLAQLEAAASGLPVVASRVGGIPEGVVDGETGFVVDEKSPEALADRIALLAGDSQLRRAMGVAGRRMVEERFDLARQTEVLECLYDQVLSPQRAG
jgi:colanic acid/amylovoran biosynthesis glycosyltransferase